MLNILWQILIWILSICGILLLCVICIFLLLVFLVLFVPIRYKGNGQKDADSLDAKLKITWLFHLFYIEIQYHNKKLIQKIRIFFFCIYDSSKPLKEKKAKSTKMHATQDLTPKESTEIKEIDKEIIKEVNDEDAPVDTDEIPTSKSYDAQASKEKSFSNWYKRILQKFKNILYTIRMFCAKIKKVSENVDYYIDIFKSEDTRNVLNSCKTLLIKALKSILPKSIQADLLIGTGSPDTTGYMLALIGMLYPYIGNTISIEPDFEHLILEGSFKFKGHILLFTLAMIALRIYCNKGLRSLIRKLKREET